MTAPDRPTAEQLEAWARKCKEYSSHPPCRECNDLGDFAVGALLVLLPAFSSLRSALAEAEAKFDSVCQEIEEGLRVRGHWLNKVDRRGAALINSVAKALDGLSFALAEAEERALFLESALAARSRDEEIEAMKRETDRLASALAARDAELGEAVKVLGEFKALLGEAGEYVIRRADGGSVWLPEQIMIGAIFERADAVLTKSSRPSPASAPKESTEDEDRHVRGWNNEGDPIGGGDNLPDDGAAPIAGASAPRGGGKGQ